MERNEALDTYQDHSYNQIIATYTFTVEVAGVTADERPELKVKQPGVNLHFLRYGVFHKTPLNYLEEDILVEAYSADHKENYQDNTSPDALQTKPEHLDPVDLTAKNDYRKPNDKLPDVEGVYYSRTQLNQGYLYILNESAPNFWLEYQVNAFGQLRPILCKDNVMKGRPMEGFFMREIDFMGLPQSPSMTISDMWARSLT